MSSELPELWKHSTTVGSTGTQSRPLLHQLAVLHHCSASCLDLLMIPIYITNVG